MKIAFLFPGQGTQKVGMGKDLYEKYDEVKEIYKRVSEITDIDVATLCFNGLRKKYSGNYYSNLEKYGEDLIKTENSQIAIATLSMSILEILNKNQIRANISVGLSLGEYPALMYSGYLKFDDGFKLLKKRGYLMQHKLPKGEYSMLAIIGLNSFKIEEICTNLNKNGLFIVPANYNYSNQTVVSGDKYAIQKAIEIFKNSGAKKVVELQTSGPFHTKALDEAKNEYIKELQSIEFNLGRVKVIKNIDGTFYNDDDNIRNILANHITNPVRFDKAIDVMKNENIDIFVEIGPGKTLTSFVKKELDNIDAINIFDVDTLENSIEKLKNFCKED